MVFANQAGARGAHAHCAERVEKVIALRDGSNVDYYNEGQSQLTLYELMELFLVGHMWKLWYSSMDGAAALKRRSGYLIKMQVGAML
jgi:hypothetical protein